MEQPAHYAHIEEEPDGKPWYYDIKRYFESGIYPEEANNNQKKTIRRLAKNYFPSREILFRRTPDLGLLRSVNAEKATKLIKKVHAGACGTHINGFYLAIKILRTGYFWMTMENNCSKYVQKFLKSKIHGDSVQMPPYDLYAMSSPWPFVAWESVITDNGDNLNSYLMNEICDHFKIIHRNSITYRPQENEGMKAFNNNIKKILRKMIENGRSWHELLPYALLGYRIIVRTSTGVTPYLVVYGNKAVTPTEVEMSFLRIIQEAGLSNKEWVCARYEQFMLIDEKRMVVVCHGQLYQHRMICAFNKKVRARTFEVG
ncbi:uncharacterized protein LOC107871776 [Capsicum annuum]|uniref:uncharacterized protein LOC107871776 n=1 Tax=Capsicum annuum TaxID=4072 RepID=UPI001FB0798D|nr:uncharacterized protein LOC107871776 [Capsicum annuum]